MNLRRMSTLETLMPFVKDMNVRIFHANLALVGFIYDM